MRTLTILLALATPSLALDRAKPPAFPDTFCVAGATIKTAGHITARLPQKVASLSGEYGSHSITDGLQTLKLRVHASGSGEWLVDATLTTTHAGELPDVVTFANVPLKTSGRAAWFETGIPNLVGYAVDFLQPRLSMNDPVAKWEPALLIGESIYTRDEKPAAPGAKGARK